MPEPVLLTIGHSNRDADAFVQLLAAHGIRTLVDVRRYPASRRHPHFNRDPLRTTLAARHVAYIHEPALGGRRTGSAERREPSPNSAWRVDGFRAYADYAMTEPFRRALDRVLAIARERPAALMCAEAVPWRCHRRLIADHAVVRGWTVRHILDEHRADEHALHEDARLRDGGVLVYPSSEGEQAELWES